MTNSSELLLSFDRPGTQVSFYVFHRISKIAHGIARLASEYSIPNGNPVETDQCIRGAATRWAKGERSASDEVEPYAFDLFFRIQTLILSGLNNAISEGAFSLASSEAGRSNDIVVTREHVASVVDKLELDEEKLLSIFGMR